jgi:hypothetical protein
VSTEQQDCPQERHNVPGPALSRRRFLGAGSAAAVTALATVGPASTGSRISPASEQEMIVQLARASAVFPVAVPLHGRARTGRAQQAFRRLRAALHLADPTAPTLTTLRTAEHVTPPGQLRSARAGAGLLIGAGLLGIGQADLLEGIGGLTATATPAARATLVAATALAMGAVFPASPQASLQRAARQWLRLLSAMQSQGTLRHALAESGLR